MTVFSFNKGEDYTVFVEDVVVGGILSVRCVENNSYSVISQYLTDVAVAKIPARNFELTFVMNAVGENIFAKKREFSHIDIIGKNDSKRYAKCYVMKIESVINPVGKVEEKVIITAEERESL